MILETETFRKAEFKAYGRVFRRNITKIDVSEEDVTVFLDNVVFALNKDLINGKAVFKA